jgi:hypothetical protein
MLIRPGRIDLSPTEQLLSRPACVLAYSPLAALGPAAGSDSLLGTLQVVTKIVTHMAKLGAGSQVRAATSVTVRPPSEPESKLNAVVTKYNHKYSHSYGKTGRRITSSGCHLSETTVGA